MKFQEWFKKFLGCEWEDYEGNLNDDHMEAAFNAGRAYEAKLRAEIEVNGRD